jgi:alpha-galactosidase
MAHTTGRVHALSFRAVTALFGHAGIEWDVAAAEPGERAGLAEWVRVHRAERDLLHGGDVVRVDHPDPSAWVHGVVAADRSRALFAYVQLTTSAAEVPAAVRLPGLDPDRMYRVAPVSVAGLPWGLQKAPPPWYAAGGVELSGRVLAEVGVRLPVLNPEQALVLRVTAR